MSLWEVLAQGTDCDILSGSVINVEFMIIEATR